MTEKTAEKKKGNWLSRALSSEKYGSITVPVFCIVLTILASSVLLLILGKNPLTAFLAFLQGSGLMPKPIYGGGQSMLSDFLNFLTFLAPMILSALAFVAGFKSGLFNIGISGQMLMSGFLASVLVGYTKLPSIVAIPLVVLVGLLVGSLMGALVGFLKYKFNIHEVVSTIMFNYIVQYLVAFFINTKYMNAVTRSSKPIAKTASLTLKSGTLSIPLGIIVAIAAAIYIGHYLDKKVGGFEIKAVGSNKKAARYIGIDVGKRMIQAMAISGALAGLAGVCYYCGYYSTITPNVLPAMGYDGITVALLGNSSPIGCIFAGALVSIFQFGANYMSSTMAVPKEISSLITGILLLFAACGAYFQYQAARKIQKEEDAEIIKIAKEEIHKKDHSNSELEKESGNSVTEEMKEEGKHGKDHH